MGERRPLWPRFVAYWPRFIFLLTFFFASACFAFSIVIWVQCMTCGHSWNAPPAPDSTASLPATPTPNTTPTPAPSATADPPPQEEPSPTAQAAPSPLPAPAVELPLIIPVAGVKASQLHDTFSEARSEGRVHNAIDIMAPRGTPVLATADGKIVKLFSSERGGITIYQLSQDEKLIFYYAHLDRYADGLTEGRVARQGEVIGYVGDTGNAGSGNYHLHFAVWSVTDPKRYWEGVNINPYPLLRGVR